SSALNPLGVLYEGGDGLDENGSPVPPNPDLATKYFREAALKGDARAQMNLGRMLMSSGNGTNDLIQAYKWLSVAEGRGDLIARKHRKDLQDSGLLSDEQIELADRLAEAEEKSLREAKSKHER